MPDFYDKFHILRHDSKAIEEVRRVESFRKRGPAGDVIRRETLVIAEQLGQSRPQEETPTEPTVRFESASYESVPDIKRG